MGFEEVYGRKAEGYARAPGRLNIIGEHTDYNEGFVLPFAIQMGTSVYQACREDTHFRVFTEAFQDSDEFDIEGLAPHPEKKWVNYVRGVVWALNQAGYAIRGQDLYIRSDLPVEAGLASSAALEVASLLAISKGSGLDIEPREMALLAQRAENEFVGVRCGIMDQFTAVLAKKDYALLLDCRYLLYRYIPLKLGKWRFVVVDSGSPRKLSSVDYNLRRKECEEAVRVIQTHRPEVKSLRDVTPEMHESAIHRMSTASYQRARHVVYENIRVQEAVKALEQRRYRILGKQMCETHKSLRDDFQVSSDVLNTLWSALMTYRGTAGARLMGGGFGGACLALIKSPDPTELSRHLDWRYRAILGLKPTLYWMTSAPAATYTPFA